MVQMQLTLYPYCERLEVGRRLRGQRELHLRFLHLDRRDLHHRSMIEQKAAEAEQQAEHRTPETYPAVGAPQPAQECAASRLESGLSSIRACRIGSSGVIQCHFHIDSILEVIGIHQTFLIRHQSTCVTGCDSSR